MRIWMLALGVLIVSTTVQAKVWTVEKDGSGDFTVIQDALDASADGDTVLVGPGRFDEFRLHVTNVNSSNVAMIARVQVDITLLGAGRDQTFLGPDTYVGSFEGRNTGCLLIDAGSESTIRGFTFENTYGNVTVRATTAFEDNRIDGRLKDRFATFNIWVLLAPDNQIRRCEILGEDGVFSDSDNLLIEDCTFVDESLDGNFVSNSGGQNFLIRNSTFDGGAGAIVSFFGGTGQVMDCRIERTRGTGLLVSGGRVVATNVTIGVTRQPLRCDIGLLEVYDSYIAGGTQFTIFSGAEVIARRCHLLNVGSEYTVTGGSRPGETCSAGVSTSRNPQPAKRCRRAARIAARASMKGRLRA